jgi:ribosomal protein S27AE
MSSPSSTSKKDYVAINIRDTSASYIPTVKLFCNICSCNLVLMDTQKEEWYCNRCGVSYFPNRGDRDKVRRGNKFETPDARDKAPIVSLVDDTNATNTRPKKSVIPRLLEMLKRTGVNITQFSSSVNGEGV